MNAAFENYADKTRTMNSQLKKLMAGGSFEEILEKCRILRANMQDAYDNSQEKYTNINNQINSKTKKDSKIYRYAEKKENVISKDKKEVEKFLDLAKARLDTIKFKTLSKVKRDSEVYNLFKFFYTFLYNEDSSNFDYSEFVKFALKKNVGEFKKRLAMFEVRTIGQKGLDELEEVNYKFNNFKNN